MRSGTLRNGQLLAITETLSVTGFTAQIHKEIITFCGMGGDRTFSSLYLNNTRFPQGKHAYSENKFTVPVPDGKFSRIVPRRAV
jgi:hypothetical protein